MRYLITQRDQQTILGHSNDYETAKRNAEGHAKSNPGFIYDVFVIQASSHCKVMDPYTIEVVK